MRCTWCGCVITGVVVGVAQFELEDCLHNADTVGGAYTICFCCRGCQWEFELETHEMGGYSRKEARNHLVEVHKLKYGLERRL